MKDGKWTAPASGGAIEALEKYAQFINIDVLARAEMIAIEHARVGSLVEMIYHIDVQQAIIENLAAQRDGLARSLNKMAEKIHSI